MQVEIGQAVTYRLPLANLPRNPRRLWHGKVKALCESDGCLLVESTDEGYEGMVELIPAAMLVGEEKEEQMKDQRLVVVASNGKEGKLAEGTSTVAFGWEEALKKANEMRETHPDWYVEIKEDKPDEDRAAFHGI